MERTYNNQQTVTTPPKKPKRKLNKLGEWLANPNKEELWDIIDIRAVMK